MTTSLTSMRAKVGQNLRGEYVTGTLTTSSASVPADTSLAEYPNDYFNDWYMIPVAGTYAGVVRKVSDFAQTGGVITPYTAFAGVTGLVAYELHKFNPTDIRDKINQALQELYPNIGVPHIDEWSLITNNILPNSLPADWTSSSTPDKWTTTGLTATQETTAANLRVGTSGLKMVSGGSAQTVMCTNSGNKYLLALAGKSITLKAWVYASDASKVALRLYDTAQSLSSYHAGDSKWHLLTLSETLAQDPTNVSLAFGYYIATTTITAYAQQIRITGINVQRYLLPLAFKEVRQVLLQTSGDTQYTADTGLAMCDAVHESSSFAEIPKADWYPFDDGTDKWLVFLCSLPGERRLKVVGNKYASNFTNETDTTEFNVPQTNNIAAKATALLYRSYANDVSSRETGKYMSLADRWEMETMRLINLHSIPRPQQTLRFSGY